MLEYISSLLNRSWCGGNLVLHNGRILIGRGLTPRLLYPAFYPIQVVTTSTGNIYMLCDEGKLWRLAYSLCGEDGVRKMVCSEVPFQGGVILAIYKACFGFYLVTTDGRLWVKRNNDAAVLIPIPFLPVFICTFAGTSLAIGNNFQLHIFIGKDLSYFVVDEVDTEIYGPYSLDCYGVVRNKDKVMMDNATAIAAVDDKLAVLKEGKVYYNDKEIPIPFTPIHLSFIDNGVLVVKGKGDEEVVIL